MKNLSVDEPKTYFERNILIIIIIGIIGLFIDYFSYFVLIQPNPWGIFIAVPGLILTAQALWMGLNPYTIVYEDRFIINQSFFYNKEFYYLDIKSIEFDGTNIILVYNDMERHALPLFGFRNSEKQSFFELLKKNIELSNLNRDF